MRLTQYIGWALGIEDLSTIDQITPSFAALWARRLPVLLVLGLMALCALSVLFYVMMQKRGSLWLRCTLAVGRALVLCLLLLFLAEPHLVVKLTSKPKPWLWLLFDGTDSMAIRDEYPADLREKINKLVGRPEVTSGSAELPTRQEDIQALLARKDKNLLEELGKKYRLKAFLFDRPDVVRELTVDSGDGTIPTDPLKEKLTSTGQVTAMGKAFEDLALHHTSGHLGGVLVVSDLDQNSGPPASMAAKKLGVPVYTLGVGSEAAVDLAVDLQAPLILKKAERASFVVTLRQTGLNDKEVVVKLTAHRIGTDPGAPIEVGSQPVRLVAPDFPVEFPWMPEETGRFELHADVEPLLGELVHQNNSAVREIEIRDDFLRLMFVEYEPTWEWRFIKEVFHRDKLVGLRGFRTFLRSADPIVRRTNELFLPTLTPKRSDFFANDVIFLGDMPGATLSAKFCEMTKEFVSKFGGGLVIVSGPRFGPGQLAGTPLADMLPVVASAGSRAKDDKPFRLKLLPEAGAYDFMQLGSSEVDNAQAWGNMGELPWYQPVARLHPQATALAVHPTDVGVDGKILQPIIAVRRYGRGEVVYLGFNETWRLRRRYGEQYYRQFWGQMIHRLGLSHALGTQKRFVVRTDRQQYQPDDLALVTVEAYNANFEPLTEEDLPNKSLTAELGIPAKAGEKGPTTQVMSIPQFREGVFESRVPLLQPGEHRVTVTDPVTKEKSEVFFHVSNVSVERRSAVRNVALQKEIASSTGGQSYDLETIDNFTQDFRPQSKIETSVQVYSLWHPRMNTWIAFGVVVGLLLIEWLVRKQINLA